VANDLRYAIRTFRKAPGFVAVAVATLALGIGANTAIFSVVNGVLLRPLPYRDADRIVRVMTSRPDENSGLHSAGEFLDLQRENQSLTALAGYRTSLFAATVKPGEPVQLEGAFVTVDFFDVLAVPAALGRTFSRAADHASRERSVVLSTEAWRQLFGGSPQAVGARLRLDGEPHTVVGVVPARAGWPAEARVWVLSQKDVPPSPVDQADRPEERDVRYFEAIARLRDGVTLGQAGEDMNRLAAVLQQRRTRTTEQRGIRVTPLREFIVGDVRDGLLIMQAAVALVLLIACANVSSLLIARATGRQRELAVRAALGAGRLRLVRQLLIESLVLGLVGGLGGLLLGAWLVVLLVGILPTGVPRTEEIALDRTVALATLGVAIVTGMLFGIMPALQASRAHAGTALKQGGERGSSGRAGARAGLVVTEVALTLVLLASAGLLVNSFLRLQRVDSGFQPGHVTIVTLLVPTTRYPTAAAQSELYRRIVEGLAKRAEIESVGVGFPGPLRGDNASGTFMVEGRPADPAYLPFANIGSVSGGYFEAMGVPLVRGRTFRDSDGADAPPVAIVNATLARKYWPGADAVGKRLRFGTEADTPWIPVVGVVGDARQMGLDQEPPPVLYIPYPQFPLPFTTIAVRSAAPEATVASLVRAQLSAIDPELPPGEIATLEWLLNRSVAEPRFRTLLISAFAVVALALAAGGVFGLISYAVSQRTREIGIRMALGATPRQVLAPLVREGLTLAGIGIATGVPASLLLGRVLSSFLYGVRSTDPPTIAAVSGVLLAVTFVATYLPSRRALRVDPNAALRTD
jgi:putative ABC transport system permease protein